VNLSVDGKISWECDSSYTSDSDKEVKCWQNRLHEVRMLNCNMMIRSLSFITKEARELPIYDGVAAVDEFLDNFESTLPEQQRYGALEWALCATPT